MPRTVTYHLVHLQTGTIANAATATMVRPGIIVGVKCCLAGVGGAATGYICTSAELNNASQANGDTNNPPREVVLFTHQTEFPNASNVACIAIGISPYVPMRVSVKIGDTISASQAQVGTAPATSRTHLDIYVLED